MASEGRKLISPSFSPGLEHYLALAACSESPFLREKNPSLSLMGSEKGGGG